MRFTEFLIETNILNEIVTDEMRATAKRTVDGERKRYKDAADKKKAFDASPEGVAKREAGKVKNAQFEKDRLASSARVQASMKDKMDKLRAMSPTERKAAADDSKRSAEPYVGK
jgi:hypothetical protein